MVENNLILKMYNNAELNLNIYTIEAENCINDLINQTISNRELGGVEKNVIFLVAWPIQIIL